MQLQRIHQQNTASHCPGKANDNTPATPVPGLSRADAFRAKYSCRYRNGGDALPTESTQRDSQRAAHKNTEAAADQKLACQELDAPLSEPSRSQSGTGRILRMPQMKALLGLSRSTIYDRLSSASPRYDPTFPQQVRLGRAAVGWLEAEVEAWIDKRVAARTRLDTNSSQG